MASEAHRTVKRWLLLGFAALGVLVFTGLGVWQVERRAWKLALIATVDRRVHAPAAPAPPPGEWPGISAAKDQYRHVTVTGRLMHDRETRVEALTEAGPGFWVLTPLHTTAGYVILVNRGFVPPDRADPTTRRQGLSQGVARVTGLLRISEPKGRFLRPNRAAEGRWYSRDVGAMAKAHGLGAVAPYFIDADAVPNPGGWPRGGLTVIAFPNNHLLYAITWFGLALMCVYAAVLVVREKA